MSAQPLSHHQILSLAEPFARRGLHVDLAASNRLERKIAFKPTTVESAPDGVGVLVETYHVDALAGGRSRIVRKLKTAQHDLHASVTFETEDSGACIDRLARVPADQFFARVRDGFVAFHFVFDGDTLADGSASDQPHLVRAEAHCGGTTLDVLMPEVRGYPADVTVTDPLSTLVMLDDDLLQVLGRRWGRLETRASSRGNAWRSTLKVARREPERTDQAIGDITYLVAHIASVLSQPPTAYHTDFWQQRWQVTARRAVPLLATFGLIGVGLLATKIPWVHGSALQMLVFNSPPLLLIALFSMRELPRIEIPRWPRASDLASWRKPLPASLLSERNAA
jgi:hypothetical protein